MNHIVLLDESEIPYSCGFNDYGQLGQGKKENTVCGKFTKMAGDLPPFSKVACGLTVTVLIDINGKVWFCGSTTAVGTDGPSQFLPIRLSGLPISSTFIDVEINSDNTLLLDSNGIVWTCGYNIFTNAPQAPHKLHDELGFRHLPKIKQMTTLHRQNQIILLDSQGELWILSSQCANTQRWRLHKINNLPPITRFIALNSSIFAIDIDGAVWVYGDNKYGELGLGHKNPQREFEKIIIGSSPIVDGSCVTGTTFFIDIQGTVWFAGEDRWLYPRKYNTTFQEFATEFQAQKITRQLSNIIFVDTEYNYWQLPTASSEMGTFDFGSVYDLNLRKIPTIKSPPITILNRFKRTKNARAQN